MTNSGDIKNIISSRSGKTTTKKSRYSFQSLTFYSLSQKASISFYKLLVRVSHWRLTFLEMPKLRNLESCLDF